MKTSRGLILFVLMACLAVPAAAQAGPRRPAALILKVSGAVMVRRADKQKPAAPRMPLQWGDRLTVPSGASALLLFSNGKQVLATAGMDVSRDAAGMAPAGDQTLPPSSFSMGAPTDLDMYGGISAGTRNYGDDLQDLVPFVRIISPRNSAVLDAPLFILDKSDAAAVAILSVTDERGDEVWAAATAAAAVEYPAAAPPLKPGGAYTVNAITALEGRTVRDQAEFQPLPRDTAKAVRDRAHAVDAEYPGPENAFARAMLLISLYKENSLYAQAAATIQNLLQTEPGNVLAWLELADVYAAMDYERGRDLALLKAAQLAADQGDPFAF